jgi:hypothetical protein
MLLPPKSTNRFLYLLLKKTYIQYQAISNDYLNTMRQQASCFQTYPLSKCRKNFLCDNICLAELLK